MALYREVYEPARCQVPLEANFKVETELCSLLQRATHPKETIGLRTLALAGRGCDPHREIGV